MRRRLWWVAVIVTAIVVLAVVIWIVKGRGQTDAREDTAKQEELITIGFAQVGAESDWRTANSISIKQTFTPERGYDLIFEDARQNQTNQIKAIRGFIQQEVDYIVFSPVVETGWDTVLEEAKRAGIPVIVIDRKVKVKDEDLYTAWVGSDFYLQGTKACAMIREYAQAQGIQEINIVNIQGTIGATSQVERTKALEENVEKYDWNLVAQESGEYNEAKAYEVMSEILKEDPDINFVYCENDNEAFGVIDAIEAAGLTVGVGGDIQVIAFDGTRGALQEVLAGRILVDLECNPLQGLYVERAIEQLEAGQTPRKEINVPERIFCGNPEVQELMLGGKVYEVELVTESLLRGREY